MAFPTRSLAKEICRLAIEQGADTPGATRLVKLLYLTDLEWRKKHKGQPLSDWNWQFWHFGPYAFEFKELFHSQEAELVEFRSGKTGRFVNFTADELRQREVPDEVSRLMKPIVERWIGVDVNLLLDYVYFETEPMEQAKRGEALDFSTLSPPPVRVSPTIDNAKLRAVRSAIANRVREMGITRKNAEISLSLLGGEEFWKEDFEPPVLKEHSPLQQSVDET